MRCLVFSQRSPSPGIQIVVCPSRGHHVGNLRIDIVLFDIKPIRSKKQMVGLVSRNARIEPGFRQVEGVVCTDE